MKEQRRFVRVVPLPSEPVEVQVIGTDFVDILRASDISEGGARITVPHLFEGCNTGGPVELIITLPRSRPFKTRGQIRHITGGKDTAFGVSFVELADADRQKIAAYVKERAAEGI